MQKAISGRLGQALPPVMPPNRYEPGDNVDIPPKFIIFRRVFPLFASERLLIFAAMCEELNTAKKAIYL